MIIIVCYVYPQTDYSRSTLSYSFRLPIQVVKTAILTQESLSFFLVKFPCGICFKPVANNHQEIKYEKCNLCIHIKCNKINKQTYTYLQTGTSYWYCMPCNKGVLPFSDTSDEELMQATIGKPIKFTHINNVPKSVKENFIQKITSETNTCKYFTMSKLQSLPYSIVPHEHCTSLAAYVDTPVCIHRNLTTFSENPSQIN